MTRMVRSNPREFMDGVLAPATAGRLVTGDWMTERRPRATRTAFAALIAAGERCSSDQKRMIARQNARGRSPDQRNDRSGRRGRRGCRKRGRRNQDGNRKGRGALRSHRVAVRAVRTCGANYVMRGEDDVERSAFFGVRRRSRCARWGVLLPRMLPFVPDGVRAGSAVGFDAADQMEVPAVSAVLVQQDRLHTRRPQREDEHERNNQRRSYERVRGGQAGAPAHDFDVNGVPAAGPVASRGWCSARSAGPKETLHPLSTSGPSARHIVTRVSLRRIRLALVSRGDRVATFRRRPPPRSEPLEHAKVDAAASSVAAGRRGRAQRHLHRLADREILDLEKVLRRQLHQPRHQQ